MIWILTGLLALTALYVLLLLALAYGLGQRTASSDAGQRRVTVMVAAHNEADRIDACLNALALQTYPPELTQVVVVDDRSQDDTYQVASSWQDRIPGLRVIRVEEPVLACPKKNALNQGIKVATGEIVLTTDADCTPSPEWIASTASCFSDGVGAVIGPAPLTDSGGRLSPLLLFQAMLVNALAAGSAGIGLPLTCSGRNFAFRKSAFDDVDGYTPIGHILGGDDVLLMRRIASAGWPVVYNHDNAAAVRSPAHLDRQWSRQIRYQSKARHYGLPILSLAMLIYIFHLLLLAGPVIAWLAPSTTPILWAVLIAKAAADGVFLFRAARRLQQRRMLRWFPLVECLAIPYIAVFCALGTLRSPTWT